MACRLHATAPRRPPSLPGCLVAPQPRNTLVALATARWGMRVGALGGLGYARDAPLGDGKHPKTNHVLVHGAWGRPKNPIH